MSEIKLEDILPIGEKELKEYKINFHTPYPRGEDPLDVFVEDRNIFHGWNTSGGGERLHLNRDYSFAVIQFHPERADNIWLFGGIYKISNPRRETRANGEEKWRCDCELQDKYKEFIGRLKLRIEKDTRLRILNFEEHYNSIIVSEILKEPYTGELFCGYDRICHSFSTLEHIWKISKPDWKAALENLKGVYVITDKSNGKKYVGSAYGDDRIWGRWNNYLLGDGHGGNKRLIDLLNSNGAKEYAKENFQFSLLEVWAREVDNSTVIERETHWKNVLTSVQHGYNEK